MENIVVRFWDDYMPGLNRVHVFQSVHDMKEWFRNSGFFLWFRIHMDCMGTFAEPNGEWQGHFTVEGDFIFTSEFC